MIDGIQEDTSNKLVLYGAKKLEDFKEKLKVYENIRRKNQEKVKTSREKNIGKRKSAKKAIGQQSEVKQSASSRKTGTKVQDPEIRCYNCGAKGHKSNDCKKKS